MSNRVKETVTTHYDCTGREISRVTETIYSSGTVERHRTAFIAGHMPYDEAMRAVKSQLAREIDKEAAAAEFRRDVQTQVHKIVHLLRERPLIKVVVDKE
jgi:hypothetical protein